MERLDLEGEISNWDAAIHLARYAAAKPYCANRSVLDLACGEGYGSAKLSEWGATSVLGVDISEEAIKKAQIRFSSPTNKFMQSSADSDIFLSQKFDLVVSLETIEHVQDTEQFLLNIKRCMHKDSIAIISCPNDAWFYANGGSNPFHLNTWTPDEFRELITRHFGSVTMMYGYPSIGFVNLSQHRNVGEKFESKSSKSEIVNQPVPLSEKESAYFLAFVNTELDFETTSASTMLGMTSYFGDEYRSFENPGDLIKSISTVEKRMLEQDKLILELSTVERKSLKKHSKGQKVIENAMNQEELFAKILKISSEEHLENLEVKPKSVGMEKLNSVRLKTLSSINFKRLRTVKFEGFKIQSGLRPLLLVCYSIYRKLPNSLKQIVKPLGRRIMRMIG